MLFAEYDRSSPIKNFTDWLNLRHELQVDDISAKLLQKVKKSYTSQVNQVLNRCFFSVFSENCEGVSKIFQLPITHVFCCILCDNSVLLHKEGWKLVSTLDSLVENIMQKEKIIKFRPQRFYSKEEQNAY